MMDAQLDRFASDGGPRLRQTLGAQPSLSSETYERWGKRALDVFLVLLSAPFVLPIVMIGACMIALEGGRPFFWQARVGRDGKPFDMLKLRSMRLDADARLARLIDTCPATAAEWAKSQKLRRDPRITKVGGLLRKTSIDELPQLWNVLVGEMSFVGPRPMMVPQSQLYPGSEYYRLRPGLTGPWQVFARNHRCFTARATYDDFYAKKQCLSYDLALLSQTWRAVFRGTGQ